MTAIHPRAAVPMVFRCDCVGLAQHIEGRLRTFRYPVRREGVRLYVTVSPDRLRLLNVPGCVREA